MAHDDEKPTSYRTPHEGPTSAGSADAPREALGRAAIPVLGAVDLELALGRPIRLDLDAEILDIEPGSALIARLPQLPTVELRRLRVDLIHGTVHADADAVGPFLLRAVAGALRVVLRRALGWQPGRSVAELLAQNLPLDPYSGARRVWAGPAGATAWLHPDARLSVELRADRAEAALTHAAVLRVLGVTLPILAVRLLFGEARVQLDPGPVGPVRRAILRLAAWLATRWLRRRMPAAMTIPGYDLFADEQRRARLVELVRRLRGRGRPRRGPEGQVPTDMPTGSGAQGQAPTDMSAGSGAQGQAPADMSAAAGSRGQAPAPAEGAPIAGSAQAPAAGETAGAPDQAAAGPAAAIAAAIAELRGIRLAAAQPPARARVLATVPLGARGEVALAIDRGVDLVVERVPGGVRVEAAGGLYLIADGLPELSELRLTRVQLGVGEAGAVHVDVQTDPPLGALLRALVRRLALAGIAGRLSLDLLGRLGLVPEPGAARQLVFRQRFSATAGLELTTAQGAAVRVRHTEHALVVEAPSGLHLQFLGLPVLPDATIRRIDYRWQDGAVAVDATPDLGAFGSAAIAQLVRVYAAPVLPAMLGIKKDGGPTIDPLLEDQFPALLVRATIPVLGGLVVRIDPDDAVRVRLSPHELALASARRLLLVAPDLSLAVQVREAHHQLAGGALHVEAEPPLGDYLSQLAARCLERFGLAELRPLVPLWPAVEPGVAWQIAQVPKDSQGPRVRAELPAGAALVIERGPDAIELRPEAPLHLIPEGSPLLAELAVEAVRYAPGAAQLDVVTQPAAGALLHEALRRAFARFVAPARLAPVLKLLALPAPAAAPPAPPPAPGTPVWEQLVPTLGAVRVALDPARTVHVSLDRRGARIGLGKGASLRAPDLGLDLTLHAISLSFLPWTVEIETTPPAGELEQQAISHALRALFAAFMRHFWPSDRSPKAGHDTLLSLGTGQPWGPLKVCVARGGSIDLHLDREGLSLRSASGLFVTGEAIDWLPDFYLHELGVRSATAAVKLAISGIQEQFYHEAAPVSPVTEAVLSHLLRVLVLPKLPAAWLQRLGLPRFSPPPAPQLDASRVVAFGATLPGEYGELLVSMDAGDTITVRASETEVSVESTRGLMATMPALRLAIQLRGARYHLQSGEVQVGGLGQLENALIEAVLRRQAAARGAGDGTGAPNVRALLDRLPVDEKGRVVVFQHKLARVLLQPGTSIRMTLDDRGLRVVAEPPLTVDGLARMNYSVEGVHYDFNEAKFEIDVEGDTAFADLFEGMIGKQVDKRLNELLLPLLPEAMRTRGYHLTTDPRARDNIARLIQTFARRRNAKG